MTSYIKILQKLEAFSNAHLQIQKFAGEFREQMPNFSTMDERYPLVFVIPVSDVEDLNTNLFTLEIYCVDIIQKDRANLNTIVSDCHLILKDLFIYYRDDNDADLDVVGTASISFVNNFDLDYVAGAVMTITFEVAGYGSCEIPMNPITPTPNVCDPTTYEITDSLANVLYSGTIPSGGTLNQEIQDSTYTVEYLNGTPIESGTIPAEGSVVVQVPNPIVCPDTTIEVNGVSEGSVVAGSTVDVITNIVPSSSSLVGNNLTLTFTKELFWELNYNDTDDIIFIPATANNVGTLTSGSGSNVGTIDVSTDGVTYGTLMFPFTFIIGQTYYFKRSTATVSGVYTMTGTYA